MNNISRGEEDDELQNESVLLNEMGTPRSLVFLRELYEDYAEEVYKERDQGKIDRFEDMPPELVYQKML
jgi:hypothetical protein